MRDANHKNITHRTQAMMYVNQSKKTQNANFMAHRVEYQQVEESPRNQKFLPKPSTIPRETHYEVPPCLLAGGHCSVEKRQETKQIMQKTYSSSLKMDKSFFKERGIHRQQTIQDIEEKHSMLVQNVTRGELQSPKKSKGSKSPNSPSPKEKLK